MISIVKGAKETVRHMSVAVQAQEHEHESEQINEWVDECRHDIDVIETWH